MKPGKICAGGLTDTKLFFDLVGGNVRHAVTDLIVNVLASESHHGSWGKETQTGVTDRGERGGPDSP